MVCSGIGIITASFTAAFLAEFAGAALGFGPAIIYEVSWELCAIIGLSAGDLEMAIANLNVIEAPCGIVQVVMLHKHFKSRLWALLNVPLATTVPIGTLMLEHCGRSLWMKRLLGILFLGLAFQQASSWKPPSELREDLDARKRHITMSVVAASMSSGLLRGIFGVAGPPMMVLLRFYSIDRNLWRCLGSTVRLTMVATQGFMLGLRADLRPECWSVYLALAIGGLTGLSLGNSAAHRVDAATFDCWLLLFLGAGALMMLCSGHAALKNAAAAAVAFTAVAVVVGPVIFPKIGMKGQKIKDRQLRPLVHQASATIANSPDNSPCMQVQADPAELRLLRQVSESEESSVPYEDFEKCPSTAVSPVVSRRVLTAPSTPTSPKKQGLVWGEQTKASEQIDEPNSIEVFSA